MIKMHRTKCCKLSYSCWVPPFTKIPPKQSAVSAWGYNGNGELGNGNNINTNVPVATIATGVLAGKTITQISAGFHSLALDNTGKVYAWGYNFYGELGNGTNTSSNVPVGPVGGLLTGKIITQISAGAFHSLALDSTGQVYAWGYNSDGQLGDGTITSSNVPVAVDTTGVLNGKIIAQISAGASHSLASDSNGQVYAWGNNNVGELGDGTVMPSPSPVGPVAGLLASEIVAHISAGNMFSLAITSNGKIYSWGDNSAGELGNGTNIPFSIVPVAVDTSGVLANRMIAEVSAGKGDRFALALDTMGQMYGWGDNSNGEFGNGTTTNSNVPVPIYIDIVSIQGSAGGNFSLALK